MFSGLQQVKRTLSRSECFSVLLGRARGIVGRVRGREEDTGGDVGVGEAERWCWAGEEGRR